MNPTAVYTSSIQAISTHLQKYLESQASHGLMIAAAAEECFGRPGFAKTDTVEIDEMYQNAGEKRKMPQRPKRPAARADRFGDVGARPFRLLVKSLGLQTGRILHPLIPGLRKLEHRTPDLTDELFA